MIIENQNAMNAAASSKEFNIHNVEYREVNHADIDLIKDVEKKSFGINIHEDELKEILDGKGRVFLAMEGEQPVAYLVVLKENIDENNLQPKLHSMLENGDNIMHDDTHIHTGKQLYWHLIGVHPSYQAKGIGRRLVRYVKAQLSPAEKALEWTACIRVNNLGSMRAFMKDLGMSMVSRKSKDKRQYSSEDLGTWTIHGSRETNFNASNRMLPEFNPEGIADRAYLWEAQELNAEPKEILIPIRDGEQTDHPESTPEKIDKIMNFDDETPKYIGRVLFKADELGLDRSESFLYFTKEEE